MRLGADRARQPEQARIFVAAMTALGDEPPVVERQLLALGFSPVLVEDLTASADGLRAAPLVVGGRLASPAPGAAVA